MSTSTQIQAPRPLPVVAADPVAPDAEGLRTSNEVDGFEYSRLRGLWFCVLALLGLPLIPFWPIFIAWEANDWSIAKDYFGTMRYVLRTLGTHIRHRSILRLFKYNLTMGPDEVKARIDRRRGACTRCAKCCRQFECVYLGQNEETQEYYCKVYKTHYWYYGTCGRYPLDQADIDDHACPGFYFDQSPA